MLDHTLAQLKVQLKSWQLQYGRTSNGASIGTSGELCSCQLSYGGISYGASIGTSGLANLLSGIIWLYAVWRKREPRRA